MQRSFHAVIMRRSLLFVLTIMAFALATAATSTAQNLNVTLPMKKWLGEVRRHWRHRHRRQRTSRPSPNSSTTPRAKFPFDFVIMNGRQPVRRELREGLRQEVRAAVTSRCSTAA